MNRDLVGQTLLKQFRVDAFVESGGMAVVYRVWDLKRNVSLAMKVLHGELADDPHTFKRFKIRHEIEMYRNRMDNHYE